MNSFASTISKAFYGTFVHSISIRELEFVKHALLFVDNHGVIVKIIKDLNQSQLQEALDGVGEDKVILLNNDQFIIPGFVDTHIHASQYSYCGDGQDTPLLEWLNTLTFPHETKFKDADYARQIYTKAVTRSLRNGTTSACWFSTVHLDATKELVDVILKQGQRAYVGKVNMDRNSPDFLTETTEASVRDTRSFIDYVRQAVINSTRSNENIIDSDKKNDTNTAPTRTPLVMPAITPRFAISCTSELLTELGKLAQEYDIPIQTHLCETSQEIESTISLFPTFTSYTAVYKGHGLLNSRSIMAHCVHMQDEEWDLIKETNAGVSHCANSNFNIRSGMANVRKMIDDLGLKKIGLGTDIAAGYSPSILEAIRCSRTCSIARDPQRSLSIPELFYLATLGGARVMELGSTIGNFEVGKEFDAIIVNTTASRSPIDIFPHDSIESKFKKYLFVGDDRNNERIYIQGKQVRLPE
ncbi:hypothetical protein BX616_011273 [Lobosporangium transversale]|uniref:Guanine deaminase n=1 Tax=Lobosporangium transversale TaxID=64571 RepID=A0A1Y2H1H1_9FUNG|nr:guanine deaminase [Lobosporangium transversale]KAF9917794.1 hypothetical protein BX616_011273 [Lobosporangium transversale]ORZ28385.1 guanine deaminase [Lobosporangium transversale]|eukprot:XP_021886070.1 guanine deaminase [Lobosporangium transversale]